MVAQIVKLTHFIYAVESHQSVNGVVVTIFTNHKLAKNVTMEIQQSKMDVQIHVKY